MSHHVIRHCKEENAHYYEMDLLLGDKELPIDPLLKERAPETYLSSCILGSSWNPIEGNREGVSVCLAIPPNLATQMMRSV